MVTLTQSMEHWLCTYHSDLITPIMFGHVELMTDELCREYIEWCKTDEGRRYLKGGDLYDANHKGNMALDRQMEEEKT